MRRQENKCQILVELTNARLIDDGEGTIIVAKVKLPADNTVCIYDVHVRPTVTCSVSCRLPPHLVTAMRRARAEDKVRRAKSPILFTSL